MNGNGSRRPPLPLPYNEQAEEAVLGAALLSDSALDVIGETLAPDDFYVPANQTVLLYLLRYHHRGEHVDLVSLKDELDRNGDLAHIGGAIKLVTLQNACIGTTEATVARWANIVLEYSNRRHYIQSAHSVLECSKDLSIGLDEVKGIVHQKFGSLDFDVMPGDPDPNITTFLEGEEDYDWLIEDLLERGDRLIITAKEGGGKSTAMRQIAVRASAGIHPFLDRPIPAVPTLVIDCENGEVLSRRKLRPLESMAHQMCLDQGWPAPDPDNLRVRIKPEGLDLLERIDVHWLMERVAADKPSLLVMGPLYKMHTGDTNDEAPAAKVSKAIDAIRGKFQCAVILEAHSPYGQQDGQRTIRPYGASLWSRWPEFGYALVESKDAPDEWEFKRWKSRDEREWPRLLIRGPSDWPERGVWPWTQPYDPNGFYNGPTARTGPSGASTPAQRPALRIMPGGADPATGF